MKKLKKDSSSLKDYFFSHFGMTKGQRSGFLFLIGLIIFIELIIQFYPFKPKPATQDLSLTPTEKALLMEQQANEVQGEAKLAIDEVKLQDFNPNALDEAGFEALGFSAKQAQSIIKYRYVVGGNFESIEQFGESYVISDKMLEKLRPYIKLRPIARTSSPRNSYQPKTYQTNTKPAKALQPFDPNKLNAKEWMDMGFSEKQAAVILNFKNSLPKNRFQSLEQIKSCFVINDYMFNKMKPAIRISNAELANQPSTPVSESKVTTGPLNPNTMTFEDWVSLGWQVEDARNIIKYKEFVGGFHQWEDLAACKYISEEDLEKLKKRMVFK